MNPIHLLRMRRWGLSKHRSHQQGSGHRRRRLPFASIPSPLHLPVPPARRRPELLGTTMSSTSETRAPPEANHQSPGTPGNGWRRVLGIPSLVLLGLVYMVPLTIFSTYGI